MPLQRTRARLAIGAWTVLDQGLFAGSNFVVNVLLARWLDAPAYGAFTLVSFAALLLLGVFHTGLLTEPMLVFGPGAFAERRAAYVRLVVRGHVAFALAAAPLVAAAGAVAAGLGEAEVARAFLALALAQGGILLMWLLRRACYVFFQPAVAVVGGGVYAVVVALGLSGLQMAGALTPATAVLLMGGAGLAAAGTIAVGLGLWGGAAAPPEMRAEALASHRRYGGWAAATGGLEWVQGVLPFLVLPVWHGLEATGAFRALFNLVMPAMHAYGALSLLLVPAFVRARAAGRLPRALGGALGAVLVGTTAYGLGIALGGPRLLDLVYDGRYAEHAGTLALFAVYPVVGGAAAVLASWRRAAERPQVVFRARAGAAGLMATAGLALIHALGVLGAIVADVLASLTEALLLARRAPASSAPAAAGGRATAGVASGDGAGAGRLRVLVSAYACIPGRGSEPGIGWNFAREMARHHDVWVLTYAAFRPTIEAELAARPVPGLRVAYYRLPFERARHLERDEERMGLAEQAHYYFWQIGAARAARALHREVGFDLAHHVTFVKYWAPCALAGLDVPFVWGPVGGGESAPRAFYSRFSPEGRGYERQRDLAQALMHLDPNVRRAARRAAVAFATTEETAEKMRTLGARRVEVKSAIGLPAEEVARLAALPPPGDGPVRFLSVGRLLAFKGYEFGLRAYAEALRADEAAGGGRLRDSSYLLLGDGPERGRLERLAAELGLIGRVHFAGDVPRVEALDGMGRAHVLVHPSLHESGGSVCLEAMAAGRPVVCFDLGGSAVHVSPDAGLLVAASDPEQAVGNLARAMLMLAADLPLRRQMGEAGRRRVASRFCWERKVAEMAARYRDVAGRPGTDALVVRLPEPVALPVHSTLPAS